MTYRLHPDAALEHEEQVAYYEARHRGLGGRYHHAMLLALEVACRSPYRFKILRPPNIRKVPLRGFPFAVIYRDAGNLVQVLAVAHYRRNPNYWMKRT